MLSLKALKEALSTAPVPSVMFKSLKAETYFSEINPFA